MNFLAHFLLSCDDEALLIGNYLADHIRVAEASQYPEAIRQGIALHRKIDSFTDAHPSVKTGIYRLHPHHRKYAPVVLDIFYDYFLANNWEKFSALSLQEFAQNTYRSLENNLHWMPAHLQQILPRMIADNWLSSYATIEGIDFTFSRLKQRVSRPEHLENVVNTLVTYQDVLNEEFNDFFPDILLFVKNECGC
ncbi:MAG TPA: acyl carrier protein phosphodiesterase [Saprospiraceae bacterium]|nr:acyl carrier protein phosphodiesterase [Saprospiraceae bacterium]HMQ83884.1 acyl carrier protein phosphodiesterase [Saprospiraceae bacterium]